MFLSLNDVNASQKANNVRTDDQTHGMCLMICSTLNLGTKINGWRKRVAKPVAGHTEVLKRPPLRGPEPGQHQEWQMGDDVSRQLQRNRLPESHSFKSLAI